MKFAELKPQFWQRYAKFTPERGGEDPLPEIELCFICPKCGPPGIVSIIVTTQAQSAGKWHSDVLPGNGLHLDEWVKVVTINPSIQCHANQHGPRRPPCNAHMSIINGEVVP